MPYDIELGLELKLIIRIQWEEITLYMDFARKKIGSFLFHFIFITPFSIFTVVWCLKYIVIQTDRTIYRCLYSRNAALALQNTFSA